MTLVCQPDEPKAIAVSKVEQFNHDFTPVEARMGDSIWEVLCEHGYCRFDDSRSKYIRTSYFVVQLNGDWLMEVGYDYALQPGDLLRIERLAGKGGGGGGSKGLGIITAIVAIVAAPMTGGMSLFLLVPSAALLLGGMAGVPKQMSNSQSQREGPSSTYSLQSQGNQARLYGTVPRLYGDMLYTPDLAAQPYVEYIGNDQYLYQLFVLTCGRCALKGIFIDETPITAYPNVETQLIPPYGDVTLFPHNVVTSIAVDNIALTNGVVAGPYVTAASKTIATRISCDFAFPGGCYQVNDNGQNVLSEVTLSATAQAVDDNGLPVGNVQTLFNHKAGFATQTPQRISVGVDMPLSPTGRWRVTCTRTGTSKTENNRFQNDVVWTGLRTYLKAEPGVNFGNVTLLAVKMKASDVLNSQTARKFKVRAVGMTPRWSSLMGWSGDVENNSIAWAAADILRNEDYGRGFLSSRIDLPELERLDALWTKRQDSFNGLFDSQLSVWEALSKVLLAGRAAPMYYAGKVEFIRDEPQSLPVQMFSPNNIVAGSFSVQHNWPQSNTPDFVISKYLDKDSWTPSEVDCALPNTIKKKPADVDWFGITNRNQAYREGMFLTASNRYRRRTIRFSVEMEGQVVRYNDLVQISHDIADWGFSGVIREFDANTGRLRTSEPLPFMSANCVIAFRKPNGSMDGPYKITPDPQLADEFDQFGGILVATPVQKASIFISSGIRSDLTMYQFGPSNRNGLKATVRAVKSRGNGLYNIECLNYVPEIYLAETGGVVPFPESPSNLVKPPVGPIIDRITVTETTTPGSQALQVSPAVGAQYYEYQYRQSDSQWAVLLGATQRTAVVINLQRGPQAVRARAVGTAIAGPWITWAGEISGSALGLPELENFTVTAALLSIVLQWDFKGNTRFIADFTSIYVSETPIPSPTTARLLGEFPYPVSSYIMNVGVPGKKLYFFAAVTDKSGRPGPWYNAMVPIEGETSSDPSALMAMLEGQIGASMLTQQLRDEILSLIESGEGLATRITQLQEELVTTKDAIATQLTQLEAQLDDTSSAITQTINQVKADVDGTLSATITMRAQLNVNGKLVTAGIGIGVTPDPDDPTQYNSELIFMASRVAFIGANLDGPLVAPLVIEGENVFMHGLFVKDATITNAKIGNAAVNTLKIAGRSVTIPYFRVRTESSIPGGLLNGWEGTIPEDTEFMIWANTGISWVSSGDASFNIVFSLKVDGVEVRRLNPSGSGPSARPDFNMTLVHGQVLTAGYHEVTLEGSMSIGGAFSSFVRPSLLLLGCMR